MYSTISRSASSGSRTCHQGIVHQCGTPLKSVSNPDPRHLFPFPTTKTWGSLFGAGTLPQPWKSWKLRKFNHFYGTNKYSPLFKQRRENLQAGAVGRTKITNMQTEHTNFFR